MTISCLFCSVDVEIEKGYTIELNNFENALKEHLDELLIFSRSKINDKELAADIVQDSLLKAVKAG
jgi:DNA-directed RNA polymerase specialized sigma24 family protein